MAETIGPFNLGLSVNFSPPLGAALDALRISIDLLRKQMDTTRLGLIIGAWTGVGPVLEPGRRIGSSTEPNPSQGSEAQRLTLAPVNDQLGRLHQNLTRLDQVISGLIWVKRQDQPAQWRAPLKYPLGTSASPVPEQRSAEGAPNLETPKVSGSFSPPLGAALDALRISIDLLRKQMDTTRLGLIIGAWTGVGPVLEPGRRIGSSTEPDHLQGPGAQRLKLAPVNDQLGRLHQNLTRLNHAISGLALVDQRTSSSPADDSSKSQQRSAAGAEELAPAAAGEAEQANTLPVYAAVATIVAGVGHVLSQQAPAKDQQQAVKAGKKVFKDNAFEALLGVGKAWATGEDGKEQAEEVGAVAGGFGGKLIGTALGVLFSKKERVQQRSASVGSALGEVLGRLVGRDVFNSFQDQPKSAAAKAQAAAQADEANPAVAGQQGQEPHDKKVERNTTSPKLDCSCLGRLGQSAVVPTAVTFGRSSARPRAAGLGRALSLAAATAFSVMPVKDRPAATPARSNKKRGRKSASGTAPGRSRRGAAKVGTSSPLGLPQTVLKKLPGLALLGTTLQLADTYSSNATPEQKLEGYGTALGGLGGGLAGAAAGAAIGSVVPVIGTAIGGLVGGVLGSMGGEQVGGWLARLVTSDTPPAEQAAAHRESDPATSLGDASRSLAECAKQPTLLTDPAQTAPTAPTPTINQQVTFTANMPVTFNNSLYDPSTLHQLEAIARGQLEELMRQARAVQMFETPHVSI
ncbi:hypothetical protein CXQ80_05610 [Pseudomonas sp. 02C 26]|uniref:hypothetical protein n=1 Tax=Pseudomonas sp. 02C 26 TaxID=2054914 RepID=UPI000C6D63AA|nr:hypothetical protein [Pseudomonas sp. 02C 26]AUF95344.1 hypothetical protein CXQ80_05610 [Pseudomonas sp. 02C 26]